MFSFSTKRLVAMIFAAIIPVLVLLLGLFLLFCGTIFNVSFALAYFLAPLLTCGLFALCIFSELFISTKKVLVTLILIVFVVGMFLGLFFVHHEGVFHYTPDEIDVEYSAIADHFSPMPSLDEIGSPTNIEYINYFASQFIFTWDAYHLICRYDDAEYEYEKRQLDQRFIYQDEPIYDRFDGTVYTCLPSVEIDGYVFRMVSIDAYDLYYPKNVILTAYCDATKEIVYISFSDEDFDSILSLDDFILDECGWEHIR